MLELIFLSFCLVLVFAYILMVVSVICLCMWYRRILLFSKLDILAPVVRIECLLLIGDNRCRCMVLTCRWLRYPFCFHHMLPFDSLYFYKIVFVFVVIFPCHERRSIFYWSVFELFFCYLFLEILGISVVIMCHYGWSISLSHVNILMI